MKPSYNQILLNSILFAKKIKLILIINYSLVLILNITILLKSAFLIQLSISKALLI